MSLKPKAIPELTGQVAKAAFPKGNIYMQCATHSGVSIQTINLRICIQPMGNPRSVHGD